MSEKPDPMDTFPHHVGGLITVSVTGPDQPSKPASREPSDAGASANEGTTTHAEGGSRAVQGA